MSNHPNWVGLATASWMHKSFVREKPEASDVETYTPTCSTLTGNEARTFYNEVLSESSAPVIQEPRVTRPSRSSNSLQRKQKPVVKSETLLKHAQYGDLAKIRECLQADGINLNVCDRYGWTPLMCSACSGNLDSVKVLVEAGADVQAKERLGRTALELAKIRENQNIVEYLENLDKKPSWCRRNTESKIRKKAAVTGVCEACNCSVTDMDSHNTSTVHLMNTQSYDKVKPQYGISERNVGYKLMVKSGWDDNEGLGRDGQGRKYPVKSILKRDRLGMGFPNSQTPRVTHFKPGDASAIERPLKNRKCRDIENELCKGKGARKRLKQREEIRAKNQEIRWRRELNQL